MTRQDTFPKLEQSVRVAPSQTYYVPAALDMQRGREAVERAVKGSILRPFDIESTTRIDEITPLWVPFWRLTVAVDGSPIPIPTGGARYKDAVVMICARTSVPYEPKLPSFFGRVSGVPPLEVGTEELVAEPSTEFLHANDAEIVDADVDRARAESIAMRLLLRSVNPTHVVHAKFEPRIHESLFCLYPLYYARYTYSGEARRQPSEDMFVAISGKTGEVVAAKYPSAARSVAAKVRRLLSFDRRGA